MRKPTIRAAIRRERKRRDGWIDQSPLPKNLRPALYWHVHHDKLVEWCYNPPERVYYIKYGKPKKEVALRLKLMKPVKIGPRAKPWLKRMAEGQVAYNLNNRSARYKRLLRLHRQQCKNCPWDGYKIVFRWE